MEQESTAEGWPPQSLQDEIGEETRWQRIRRVGRGISYAILLISIPNSFVWWFATIKTGGDSLGVLPSEQGFVVAERGTTTAVSEPVWLLFLVYPYLTLTLTPLGFVPIAVAGSRQHSVPQRLLVGAFLLLWAIGWYASLTAAFVRSLLDWADLRFGA